MSSPGIPANTPVGAASVIPLVPNGPGGLPKSTTNYIAVESGTVTLNGATPVTVAAPAVTANSQFLFTLKTVGGTVGAKPAPQTTTPGTGFTVQGTAGDTSIYNYMILG